MHINTYSDDIHYLSGKVIPILFCATYLAHLMFLKSRKMKWEEYVWRMGRMECVQDFGGKCRRKATTKKT
jgi:hypothetical protein